MAVSAGYLPLFLSFFFLVCFSKNPIPALSDTTGLATKVCKSTTIFDFCHAVIYSDPRAPTADRVTLAFIAFELAYANTSKAAYQIASRDKDVGMQKCQRLYGWAAQSFSEAMGNMYSQVYGGLDRLAVKGEGYARDCESSFSDRPSPLSVMNQDLINFSNICDAVSHLFPQDADGDSLIV
ncbi:cell wall / vacuolar inhibitor of fructosidase 2-like [Henckelia pumila]|uniref:cell wall / vacuolar inhibitor of fructosidase 2-like n=1 Tax=Henckelia pumila TaxID=405737 RepID=UPI003C6DF0EC